MQVEEAADKLRHYAEIYGDWIYDLSPLGAAQMAVEQRSRVVYDNPTPECLNALVESVHFESIQRCLSLLYP